MCEGNELNLQFRGEKGFASIRGEISIRLLLLLKEKRIDINSEPDPRGNGNVVFQIDSKEELDQLKTCYKEVLRSFETNPNI